MLALILVIGHVAPQDISNLYPQNILAPFDYMLWFSLFQFLGECVVEKTKGTEVVKEAIRKMKVRRSNCGILSFDISHPLTVTDSSVLWITYSSLLS